MNTELTKMENELISLIIEENKSKIPKLEEQIRYLKVSSRVNTGVGIYINFLCQKELNETDNTENNLIISSDKSLYFRELKYELSYVLFIVNGKISLLEIITNGNEVLISQDFVFDYKIV